MKRIGAITPSSNVMVEQVTQAMLAGLGAASAHFARFSFHGSTDPFPDDYDWEGMLSAAALLGHAGPDVICWNGSKGGTIGFARDRLLCERIRALTGIPAVTSTLALDDALRARNAARIAFVTPYRTAFLAKVVRAWQAEGYRVTAALGAELDDNRAFATLDPQNIAAMSQKAAETGADAIVYFCTNMAGAYLCAEQERALGLPVFDAVSAGVCASLRRAGIDTSPLSGPWGSLFQNVVSPVRTGHVATRQAEEGVTG